MIAPEAGTGKASNALRLELRRTFAAPRERVFRAWTDPELFKQWWGPRGFTTPSAEIDLRVGGKYRVAMQPPQGETLYVYGTYREVRPPERLVYTWQWEGDDAETLVTVEFIARGETTEVALTHERFASDESRQAHTGGWTECLDRLGELLTEHASRA